MSYERLNKDRFDTAGGCRFDEELLVFICIKFRLVSFETGHPCSVLCLVHGQSACHIVSI